MIPLFIPSHFGEHYQLLAWGQMFFPNGEVVTTTDAARLFSIITRELTIPAEQWRGVLMRLNVSIPPNFFHTADIYHELVKLFQRRQLQLVKIPRLEQLPTIKAEEGWGYCFTQGPHRHPSLSYSPVAITSLQYAQALLSDINISEKALSHLLASSSVGSIEKLAELLANHSVLVYKIPVPTAAPPVKPVEFLPATAADRPVPLGPDTDKSSTSSSTEKPRKVNAAPAEDAAPFKRAHKDGNAKDPYTLQADGKPLGAQEGAMPKACKGLSRLPENHGLLVEQGYPDLHCEWKPGRFATDYANFSDARPDVLPPGTKLYRILDEQANPAGAYWATALPESKASWRGNYAVKDSWNDNGYYTEYTVPPGDGLKVWRGTTAGQKYEVSDGKKFYLEGGKEQIFVSPNTVTPAPKKFTSWTDARS